MNFEDTRDIKKLFELVTKIPPPVFKTPRKYPGDKKAKEIREQFKKDVDVSEVETTRVSALFLNRFANSDEAFPLLFSDKVAGLAPTHQCPVLEVVLNSLPMPDQNYPWEKIVDFRSDPDSRHKFNALRVWMQDISRQSYSKSEIEDRISNLMNEYETHMRFHRLKFKRGTMKVLTLVPLEILENLLTFKWGKIAESFFSLRDKKYDLLEAEMGAPGKEIAYIMEANRKIGNQENP